MRRTWFLSVRDFTGSHLMPDHLQQLSADKLFCRIIGKTDAIFVLSLVFVAPLGTTVSNFRIVNICCMCSIKIEKTEMTLKGDIRLFTWPCHRGRSVHVSSMTSLTPLPWALSRPWARTAIFVKFVRFDFLFYRPVLNDAHIYVTNVIGNSL